MDHDGYGEVASCRTDSRKCSDSWRKRADIISGMGFFMALEDFAAAVAGISMLL